MELMEKFIQEEIEKFIQEEDGVTAIEYGILAALIIVVCVAIIGTVGSNLLTVFTTISTAL